MSHYTLGKGKLQIREKFHYVWITCGQYVEVDPAVLFLYNTSYEHYIPAKEEKAQKNPWLPCKIQVQVGEKNDPAQKAERALET